jgi:hypothetical protein
MMVLSARREFLRGVALSDDGTEQAGMGVGIDDYNLDRHLDLFKTHFIGDASGFYRTTARGALTKLAGCQKLPSKRALRVGAPESLISTMTVIPTCSS